MGLGWEQQGAIRGIRIERKAFLFPGPCQIRLHPQFQACHHVFKPLLSCGLQWLQGHSPHLADGPPQHSPCLRPLLFSGSLGYNSPSLHLVILPIQSTAQKAAPSATGKPGQMRIADVNMFCDGMSLGVGPILTSWGSLTQLLSHGQVRGESGGSNGSCITEFVFEWSFHHVISSSMLKQFPLACRRISCS